MVVVSGGVDVAEFGDQFSREAGRLDSWMDTRPTAPYAVQRAASEAHTLSHIFRSGLPVYRVGGESLDEIQSEMRRMLVFDRGDAPTDNGLLAIERDVAQFAVRTVTERVHPRGSGDAPDVVEDWAGDAPIRYIMWRTLPQYVEIRGFSRTADLPCEIVQNVAIQPVFRGGLYADKTSLEFLRMVLGSRDKAYATCIQVYEFLGSTWRLMKSGSGAAS